MASAPLPTSTQQYISVPSKAQDLITGNVPGTGSRQDTKQRYLDAPPFGSTSLAVLAQYKDIWLLGVFMAIGGQYFHWNEGMMAGFWNFFMGAVLTSIGYICLTFCMAELTSILPFSGGTYGFARVTVSFFGGYIVGCCEVLEYVTYVATSVYALGRLVSVSFGVSSRYEPIYWFLFYATSIAIQMQGGRFFWRLNTCLAVVSALVLCLYCLACIPIMDFSENARLDQADTPWFTGRDGFSFMRVLPLASWFFVGIEAVPLAGQETQEVNQINALPLLDVV